MNKTTKRLFLFFATLFCALFAELGYLYNTHSVSAQAQEKKQLFVSITSLPDLALSTEADYVRHRSLSDVFSLFKDGPMQREYFVSTYVYAPSQNYFRVNIDAK